MKRVMFTAMMGLLSACTNGLPLETDRMALGDEAKADVSADRMQRGKCDSKHLKRCHKGTYCDLTTLTCKPDCQDNSQCPDQLCDLTTHQCRDCADSLCPAGQVCVLNQCAALYGCAGLYQCEQSCAVLDDTCGTLCEIHATQSAIQLFFDVQICRKQYCASACNDRFSPECQACMTPAQESSTCLPVAQVCLADA